MSSLSELQFPNDLHAGHPATTRTGTHLEFSTQVFGSLNLSGMTNVDDRSHLDESYELSRSTRHDFRSHRHRHRRHHPPNHHQNHHVQHRQLDSQNISQRYVGACDTTQISTLSLGWWTLFAYKLLCTFPSACIVFFLLSHLKFSLTPYYWPSHLKINLL